MWFNCSEQFDSKLNCKTFTFHETFGSFLESRAKFPKVQSALPRSGSVLWLVSLLFDLTLDLSVTVSQGFSSVYCRLSDYLGFTFRLIPLNIISLSITVEPQLSAPRLSGLFHYQDFYVFPWFRAFFSWILITCDLIIISYCIIYLFIYLFIYLLSSYNYTWSYENRVSKHFAIFLNFPCLVACSVLFASVVLFSLVLWLGICVEVDVDRITISPTPPYFFLTHNSLFNRSDSHLKSVRA